MERQNTALAMLALLQQPAFCAENGMIFCVNDAAQQLQIAPDTQVMDILQTGKEEYAHFSEGCLYLTIVLSGCQFSASVTKVNTFDVFVLEHEDYSLHLQPLALAAKELRAPLAGIMAITDMLLPALEQTKNPKTAQQVAQLNRNLYQIQRMVGNMSDSGRLSANPSVRLETREIISILQEILEKIEDIATGKEITFHYTLPQQSMYCLVDSQLIERAVYNLISNAIKFTPAGGYIDIRLAQQNNHLYLSVTNTGEIPSELQNHVFTRYLRNPSIEDSRYGIGLGMVIIRAAATAHGGTVLVEQPEKHCVRITMTINMAKNDTILRSNIHNVDYAGEHSHLLVELSDCLDADYYHPISEN